MILIHGDCIEVVADSERRGGIARVGMSDIVNRVRLLAD